MFTAAGCSVIARTVAEIRIKEYKENVLKTFCSVVLGSLSSILLLVFSSSVTDVKFTRCLSLRSRLLLLSVFVLICLLCHFHPISSVVCVMHSYTKESSLLCVDVSSVQNEIGLDVAIIPHKCFKTKVTDCFKNIVSIKYRYLYFVTSHLCLY